MTVNGFQSFSFTTLTLNVSATSPTTSGLAPKRPGADSADRVTLSPDATAGAAETPGASAPTGEPTDAAPAPPVATPWQPRTARRADALFTALDADHDGSLTANEFKDGALALLRNAGAGRRVDGDDDGHRSHGLRRLERRLDKAFDSIDKNDDGAIDKDELTAALARSGRRRHGRPDGAPPPETAAPNPTVQEPASVSFSVTFVSIAVQRYTSVEAATQPPTTAAGIAS